MSRPESSPHLLRKSTTVAGFPLVLCGVSIFLIHQYVLSILRLTDSAKNMDNKFSSIARDQFLGFLIGQNALMLVAYAILAVIGAVLLQPFVSWITGRLGSGRKIAIIACGWGLAYLANNYFTVRMVESKPYFLPDAGGNWYSGSIGLLGIPGMDGFFFTVLPLMVLAVALFWQIHRQGKRGWIAAAVAGLIGAGVLGADGIRRAKTHAPAKGQKTPNILIIGSDSLRADRLGVSGYRPARSDGPAAAGVSPVIDALAARSINFQTCYSPIGSTLESGTSFMASQYPHTHGLRHMFPNAETIAEARKLTVPMAQLLREKGYDTAAIGDWCAGYYELMPLGFEHISVSSFDNFKVYMSQAVVMAHNVIPVYFDNALGYKLFPQINSFASFVTPDVVTNRVRERLGDIAGQEQPFFWHVFYSCTHLPYQSKEPYASMFTDPAAKKTFPFDVDSFASKSNLEEFFATASPEEITQINAVYDGCVRQFDDCVKEILDSLKQNGLDGNTIVIITGDHGDDLYDPGVTLLHGQGFNGGLQASHVPMIIHVPGLAPKAIPETVRLIDVMPTLADMTGIQKPAVWEGKSFAGWMNGSEPPVWRPFYGETGFPFMQSKVAGIERPPLYPLDRMTYIEPAFNYQLVIKPEYDGPLIAAKQRCLRTRYWKLVCTPAADGSRHFGLFHLPTDPNGRNDLAKSRSEILAPLQTALNRWIDAHHESSIAEIFPAGEPH